MKVTQTRGQRLETEFGVPALMTVHPSSLLRHAGAGNMEEEFEQFVNDLRRVRA